MQDEVIEADLALTDVYQKLDDAEIQMNHIVRDYIYSLLRCAYRYGVADGISKLGRELRKANDLEGS